MESTSTTHHSHLHHTTPCSITHIGAYDLNKAHSRMVIGVIDLNVHIKGLHMGGPGKGVLALTTYAPQPLLYTMSLTTRRIVKATIGRTKSPSASPCFSINLIMGPSSHILWVIVKHFRALFSCVFSLQTLTTPNIYIG